jgi:drug/metabolite transporter superfamily protein YnfA
MSERKKSEFEQAAVRQGQGGFFSDLWGFLKENKKWWLLPLIMAFLVFALLIFLSGTGLAPFIYTLF